MRKSKSGGAIALLGLYLGAGAISLHGQEITTLVTFKGTNGARPYGALVQGIDGDLYGTTNGNFPGLPGERGPYYQGTVFKISLVGELTTLAGLKRASPAAALVQATNGDLYGTTARGGQKYAAGTIFRMTHAGALTTLHTDCSGDACSRPGVEPVGLMQATGGDLYGVDFSGTVFEVTPRGKYTGLCYLDAVGKEPFAGVVQGSDGNFYGTTELGGTACAAPGCGAVFKMTPAGALSALYEFCSQPSCADGSKPFGALIQASDGNLYGTTAEGGDTTSVDCTPYGCGTVFRITLDGTLTTLNTSVGYGPQTALVQGTDENLYGTASGSLFRMTLGGVVTGTFELGHGENSFAPLIQATDGNFYGVTFGGSRRGTYGTVFRLSMGLGPFVKTLQPSGPVGAAVTILGTNMAGATGVSFNGTPAASFAVNSTGSAIATAVPSGATSGAIQVKLPGGTLSSSVPFLVTQ